MIYFVSIICAISCMHTWLTQLVNIEQHNILHICHISWFWGQSDFIIYFQHLEHFIILKKQDVAENTLNQ